MYAHTVFCHIAQQLQPLLETCGFTVAVIPPDWTMERAPEEQVAREKAQREATQRKHNQLIGTTKKAIAECK